MRLRVKLLLSGDTLPLPQRWQLIEQMAEQLRTMMFVMLVLVLAGLELWRSTGSALYAVPCALGWCAGGYWMWLQGAARRAVAQGDPRGPEHWAKYFVNGAGVSGLLLGVTCGAIIAFGPDDQGLRMMVTVGAAGAIICPVISLSGSPEAVLVYLLCGIVPAALGFAANGTPFGWAIVLFAANLLVGAVEAGRRQGGHTLSLLAAEERRAGLTLRLDGMCAELNEANAKLFELSRRDALTGLTNRRGFDARLRRAWTQAAATGEELALVFLDVDFFKLYNDNYGHPAGDSCLRQVAHCLEAVLDRPDYALARWGGEEFVAILPGCTLEAAREMAQTMRLAVQGLHLPHRAAPLGQVSISLGVSSVRPSAGLEPERLLKAADSQLYAAKQGGRNQVRAAPLEAASGPARDRSPAARGVAGQPAEPPPGVVAEAPVLTPPARLLWLSRRDGRLRLPSLLETDGMTVPQRWRMVSDLFENMRGLFYAHAAMTVLGLIGFLWTGAAWLLGWGAAAMLLYLARLWTCHAFNNRSPASEPEFWAGWFFRGAVTLGAMWGLMCGLVVTFPDPEFRTLVLVAMTSWVSGAAVRNNMSPSTVVVQTLLAVLPALAALLLGGMEMGPQTAIFLLIYVYVGFASARSLARQTVYMMASEQYLLATSDRLASLRPELEAANDELRRLSNTDGLTGVTNRREFDIALSRAWSEAALDRHKISLLMLDVDRFKQFNDVFGHAAGDACLRAVAGGLQSALAGSGYTLARYGGEEFAVILPGAGPDIAHMVAENLRQVVAGLDLAQAAPTLLQKAGRVTVSIGLASEAPIRAGSGRPLVDGADAALYLAKKSGRNCVRSADEVEAAPVAEVVNDRPAS